MFGRKQFLQCAEHPLRDEIPRLRASLTRAKASGNGALVDLEDAPVVAKYLVPPEPSTQTG